MDSTVVRLNANTGEVLATIAVEGSPPDAVSVGGAGTWLSAGGGPAGPGFLYQIDLATNELTTTIGPMAALNGFAVGEDALWAAESHENAVYRIDPVSGEILAEVPVRFPIFVKIGAGGVWVSSQGDDTAVQIDPERTPS